MKQPWTSFFYLSPMCLFTVTGPIDKKLHLYFSDENRCRKWPRGCSVTIWDGDYKMGLQDSSVLLQLPHIADAFEKNLTKRVFKRVPSCASDYNMLSTENVITIRVDSCLPMPTPDFNFTAMVTVTSADHLKHVNGEAANDENTYIALTICFIFSLAFLMSFLVFRLFSPKSLPKLYKKFGRCYGEGSSFKNYVAPLPINQSLPMHAMASGSEQKLTTGYGSESARTHVITNDEGIHSSRVFSPPPNRTCARNG